MTATFPTSFRSSFRTSFRAVAPPSSDPRDQVARAALSEYLATHDPLATADLTFPERHWERIGSVAGAEIWLITWPPGSSTGWHDHGSAAGAFVTLRGQLTEYVWTGVATASTLAERAVREFDGSHIHDVVNHGTTTAVSVHAYAPSLAAMTRYELVRGRLQVTTVEQRTSW